MNILRVWLIRFFKRAMRCFRPYKELKNGAYGERVTRIQGMVIKGDGTEFIAADGEQLNGIHVKNRKIPTLEQCARVEKYLRGFESKNMISGSSKGKK